MITIKNGDLLNATETIIAHQVNCFGIAGGLAFHVFKKWHDAENDYMQICNRIKKENLLGMAQITGQQSDGHIIANLFGQFRPGADYNPKALENALSALAKLAKSLKVDVALPYKISCGICGGDWEEVYAIIERTMQDVKCTIYKRECDN